MRRTLPIERVAADCVVLRGPVNGGMASLGGLIVLNPAVPVVAMWVTVVVFGGPSSLAEILVQTPPILILLTVLSALTLLVSIVFVRRGRTLRIALYRGRRVARFSGPAGIDICLPLVGPFLLASAGEQASWTSPAEYKARRIAGRPWRRRLRLWPLGRIPTLVLRFPDKGWVALAPVSGARESDFVACWEWLLRFLEPSGAPARAMAPGPVLQLAGGSELLTCMSIHTLTTERMSLFWVRDRGFILLIFAAVIVSLCGMAALIPDPDGWPFPIWLRTACCLVAIVTSTLFGLRLYSTVVTFSRGAYGAFIERGTRRERVPQLDFRFADDDGIHQVLMRTPRKTLRGRRMHPLSVESCVQFIHNYCKPPEEVAGVDADVHDPG